MSEQVAASPWRRRRGASISTLLAVHFVDATVAAVSRPGIWQHYNLDLFRRRGGEMGEPYGFDDLCPTVYPQRSTA
jgi:hypothetical protein